MYETDLAYIHDAGFTAFADRAAPAIIHLLRRHGIHDGLVVDVGCGSGPLAAHLIAADYEVVGIDASGAMIRLARARAPGATFRRGSLETARIPRSAAVIALNEVVSYVPDPRGRLAALRRFFARVYAALRPGGLLVFDFIASADRRTYAGKSRSGGDWAVAAGATLGRSGRVLTREITTFRKIAGEYRKARETHRVQLYDPKAVEKELRTLGFAVTMRRSYGRLPLLPGDLAVIAQKR